MGATSVPHHHQSQVEPPELSAWQRTPRELVAVVRGARQSDPVKQCQSPSADPTRRHRQNRSQSGHGDLHEVHVYILNPQRLLSHGRNRSCDACFAYMASIWSVMIKCKQNHCVVGQAAKNGEWVQLRVGLYRNVVVTERAQESQELIQTF